MRKLLLLLIITPLLSYSQTQFSKYSGNPVLESAEGGNGSWDIQGAGDPNVLLINDTLKMWYTVTDSDFLFCQCCYSTPPYDANKNKTQIAYAWSLPGENSWNIDTPGPVISPGPAVWDELGIEAVSVVYDTAAPDSLRYKMWYTGFGDDLCDPATTWQIGYAFSHDGISWTKYSGNPVMASNSIAGNFDRTDHALQGPSVLIDENAPPGERLKMWYTGIDYDAPGTSIYAINHAWSGDGISWVKSTKNPVLVPGLVGSWETKILDPHVLPSNGSYLLWYVGYNTDDVAAIGYASSGNGTDWIKTSDNPILRTGSGCDFDASGAHSPAVLFRDSTFTMWYEGSNSDTACVSETNSAIGLATSPVVGIHTVHYPHREFKAFPNPFADKVTFEIQARYSGKIALIVYDITGREVASLRQGVYDHSKISIIWEPEGLPAGIYLYEIKEDGMPGEHGKLMKSGF